MQRFLTVNREILECLKGKFDRVSEGLRSDGEVGLRGFDVEELLRNTKYGEISQDLEFMLKKFKTIYKKTFYEEGKRKEAKEILKKLVQEKTISRKEKMVSYFFGSVTLILIGFIIFLAINGEFEDRSSFFTHVFPIYRGGFFVILYIWLLAWNVSGWNMFNIDYRRMFQFNELHYSTVSQILKRSMFFSSILLLSFLWFVLIKCDLGVFSTYLNAIPNKKIIPMSIWIALIIYMFFPIKNCFNWAGRLYVFKLFLKIFCLSPFYTDFCMNWTTDQLVSFVIPLKDLAYTFFYLIAIEEDTDKTNEMIENCTIKTLYIGFVAACIPLFLRMIQCFSSARLRKQNEKNAYFYDILNLFKYLCSLLVAVFSFLAVEFGGELEGTYALWIAFAVVSTCYSYVWDIKMDWGLAGTGTMLRQRLLYNQYYYYVAILSNFLFRFSWMLTLSNGVNPFGLQKELFIMLIGSLEMFRRSIWNFLRVENEYIFHSDMYKSLDEEAFPYEVSEKIHVFHKKAVDESFSTNAGEECFVEAREKKREEEFKREFESLNYDRF